MLLYCCYSLQYNNRPCHKFSKSSKSETLSIMYQTRFCKLSSLNKSKIANRWFSSRRNRSAAMQQKQEDLFSMMDSHQVVAQENNSTDNRLHETKSNDESKDEVQVQRLQEDRVQLYKEAGMMTRALYRSCLRNVNLIRDGNQHDFADFEAREEEQKTGRLKKAITASFSFEPPVDRDNELSSRALYYLAYTKESFHQEVDCLEVEPWREDNLNRFLFLMKEGDEKRKWVLNDYKFDDPHANKLEEVKLEEWEAKAWKLIRETYDSKGWVYLDDFAKDDEDYKDEGIDWDEDDDSEEETKR
jgi:outer membrane phospholipase A